jgi:hypothetical protein
MPEQPRTRDCVILAKGDTYPVTVDAAMALGGWRGGQAVQWVAPIKDEFLVTYSDGYYAGFLLWGSDESSDQFTAMTRNQPYYRFATVGAGGWQILTTSYEVYTWRSRNGLEPSGTKIVYSASDRLVFSLRGFFTKEDEWWLSGDPRGHNTYFIAFVSQAPSALNSFYMGVQVSI